MKKRNKGENGSQNSWSSLIGKITQNLTDAIEEGRQDAIAESNFTCLKNGTFDFDMIERDIERIHQNWEKRGRKVLATHLILDDKTDFVIVNIYTEKSGKTYETTLMKVKVQEIINIPDQIANQLEKEKRSEITFVPN
ncbi:MAG: hypothetical protein IM319_12870 [Microcystis sp. M113S1]|jgi:hypothetical protein|uniref:hypothetical protein n=1 Tax=Microcystis sp. M113S1 TaxID=2771104 RepID=UPI00258CC906|nr:hypothetical protein [Microcystis sp. M113S1]MCU7243866.1 hypothetical protein [Microcystis aeruginosa WS75]NCR06891.1 hypothetical protein [Microcystis aeruginosa LG13-11]NCR87799.1 hypothetical protein [Microcystis aeruginosa G13-10]NCS05217.1 hypothetical protein [Microcystis aeruginosa G13-07]NCS32916.1 hypothetical protein [Microcystis aeruginosa G11-01]NCS37767.1 hypothetical protein [Microcystis aeruginosa BS13-10]NCS42141.1 hypothetical protein [Microcystis aeruginosa BS11-05]NCS